MDARLMSRAELSGILKVMAGDRFTAKVFGWYQPGNTDHTVDPVLSMMLSNLVNSLSGSIGSMGKNSPADILSTGVLNLPLQNLFQNQPPSGSTVPKAYLNYIVLSEAQLKYVVGGAVVIPEITGTMEKQLLQINNGQEVSITTNGYLYVYVSNESKGNVYFDDLMIEHIHGPLLEEAHYYPFGLVMSGISSKALNNSPTNRFKYNGKEEQRQEFSDGSGLEWLDYGARMYDNQTGRWNHVDPLSEKYLHSSPYVYVDNNPISRFDIDGREWADPKDKEKKESLAEQSRKRIDFLKVDNQRLEKNKQEALDKGKTKKAEKIRIKMENNEHQIRDLDKGIEELQFLEDSKDYFFTFTKVDGNEHHVSLLKDGEKPLISIDYSTEGSAMHEARHVHQYITEAKKNGYMYFGKDLRLTHKYEFSRLIYEIRAYQLHYSFDAGDLPIYSPGFYGINKAWLKSISGNPYNF